MAKVFPFRGEIYNQERVNLGLCVTPPYDVISEDEQEAYYQKSPYNIIRLILPKGERRYESAKKTLESWRRENILKMDEKECFYLYEQEWEIFEEKGTLRGIIASLCIEDYKRGIILPHERVLPKPKEDRLKLLSACNTDFSPIFFIYSDDDGKLNSIMQKKGAPFIEFEYKKGLFCRLFRIEETNNIKNAFKDKRLFIADGHHRYDASLTYFKETKDIKKKRTMALISSIEYGGFKILPAHRILKNAPDMERIKRYFNLEVKERREIFSTLSERKKRGVFGLLGKDFSFIISIKEKSSDLDVSILHKLLFDGIDIEEDIEYTIDRNLVFERIKNSAYAFILRPTDVYDVIKIASKGERLPGKATYFYPKPFCGLVLHPLE